MAAIPKWQLIGTVLWLFTSITYIRRNTIRGLHTLGSGCIMSILCNQWEYSIFQPVYHKYIFFLLLLNILIDNIGFLAFLILFSQKTTSQNEIGECAMTNVHYEIQLEQGNHCGGQSCKFFSIKKYTMVW